MRYSLRRLRLLLSIVLVGCLSGSTVFAQSAACDWTRVTHLRPGQSIVVRTGPGQPLAGRLVSATDTDITLAVGDVRRVVVRDQVAEVSARLTARRITGLVLAIGGTVLMVANAATRPPEAGPGPMLFAGTPLMVAGSFALRAERGHTGLVYRRP
jgi:hypothetical protein